MAKFADQWEPNGPFGIVTDSNMSGGYRVVTNDADKTDITILPPERQKVGMLVYVTATNKTWRLTTVGVRSPGTETYSVNPVFTDATVSVGTAISGGTADSVLYIDSAGNLAQSADLKYVASSKVLTAGALTLDGTNGNIYRTSYGGLSIGNDGNTGAILIGTIDNDDSVVIGRESGPDTYIDSNLFVKGTLTMYGPDKIIYTGAIDSTGGSTIAIGSAPGTSSVTLGRVGGGVTVPSILTANADIHANSVINANGGIGISTGNTLNIGNDDTITSALNINTTGITTPAINIGKDFGGVVTVRGSTVNLGSGSTTVNLGASATTVNVGAPSVNVSLAVPSVIRLGDHNYANGATTVNLIDGIMGAKESKVGTTFTRSVFLGGAYSFASPNSSWGGGIIFGPNFFAGTYHIRLQICYGKVATDTSLGAIFTVSNGTMTFNGTVATNAVSAPPTPGATTTIGAGTNSGVTTFNYYGGFVRTGSATGRNYLIIEGTISFTSATQLVVNTDTNSIAVDLLEATMSLFAITDMPA